MPIDPNKMNSLYQMATGKNTESSMHEDLRIKNSKLSLAKARDASIFTRGANKDPYIAFTKWWDVTRENVDSYNRNDYWDLALKLFPGDETQAKDWLRTEIGKPSGDSYGEEVALRNHMSVAPDWAQAEISPKLSYLQSTNSNQNLMKAVSLYKKNLTQRLTKLSENPLDLDVPEEQHIQDFLKLEAMNLLDVASVQNGRLLTANDKGVFVPAFMIEERDQVLSKNSQGTPEAGEMDLIYRAAPDIIRSSIKSNLDNVRQMANVGNKAASASAMKILENGDMKIEDWAEAYSITSGIEPDSVLTAGIRGLAKNNPYRTAEEIHGDSAKIMLHHKELLNQISDRRANVPVSEQPKN